MAGGAQMHAVCISLLNMGLTGRIRHNHPCPRRRSRRTQCTKVLEPMDLHTAGHFRGVVAAPHHAAAEAGRDVIAEGGNAIEAMIAMAATIAAVYPHMNHIGGDGFWLFRAPIGRIRAIDAAGFAGERRPPRALSRARDDPAARAARRAHGAGRGRRLGARARSRRGASAAGCRLTALLAPAIRAAREGYTVTRSQARLTAEKLDELQGRARLRGGLPDRREAAGGRRRAPAASRSPARSTISPRPGSTTSIAATSGARSPPTSTASAAR